MVRRPKRANDSFAHAIHALEQTGFYPDILEMIFVKYCGRNTKIPTRTSLYELLHFLRQYPTMSEFTHTAKRTTSRGEKPHISPD